VDKVFSVEVAQHFISLHAFAKEMSRILKPEGLLCFVAQFGKNAEVLDTMKRLNLVIKGNNLRPIQEVISALEALEFAVKTLFIGKYVFPGYERWITQESTPTPISHHHYKAYIQGFLEYVCFFAKRPSSSALARSERGRKREMQKAEMSTKRQKLTGGIVGAAAETTSKQVLKK